MTQYPEWVFEPAAGDEWFNVQFDMDSRIRQFNTNNTVYGW
jgi:hypothetical protein